MRRGRGGHRKQCKMKVRGPKSGFRKTIIYRRELRHNTTPAEKIFWSKVANRTFQNLKFRKQHGIGPFVVDFYCPEKKIIVEIDGDSHATDTGIENDQERAKYLAGLGYKIVRYQNSDVLNNIDGVFEDLSGRLSQL